MEAEEGFGVREGDGERGSGREKAGHSHLFGGNGMK